MSSKLIVVSYILNILKDLCVVVCSILGTNFIISLCVQKNDQNNLYTDIISGEVFSDKSFCDNIPEEHIHKLLVNLSEHQLVTKYNIKKEMYKSVLSKIDSIETDYYYTLCDTIVECNIEQDYIEKRISKTICLRAYDKQYNLTKYIVAGTILKTGLKVEQLEVEEVIINGKKTPISPSNYHKENNHNRFYKKSSYDTCLNYILNSKIVLSQNKDTKIEVKYITRVNKDDWSYTSRVKKPCKKYRLKFMLYGDNKTHKIVSSAFGFLDNAQNTHNTDNKNEVYYEFNDWIFSKDGVSITFI